MRQESLFLTRLDWISLLVLALLLIFLLPFALMGYELAYRLLLDGAGFIAGFGTAELIVNAYGRGRRVGLYLLGPLLLAGFAFMVCVILLLLLPFFLPFEDWRYLFVEGGDRTPLYLVAAGFVSGLASAGADVLLLGSSMEEAREQQRNLTRANLRAWGVVAGALVGLFGLFFALYLVFWYVLAPLIRHFAQ